MRDSPKRGATTPGASNELLANYESVRTLAMRSLFDMLDSSSEGTVVVDRDARIVWMNQHYAARFGFSDPQQAIGRDCEEVIPNSLLREVVSTGKPILLDIMETERDPLVVTRLPICDFQGNVIGAVGFALFDELKALTPLFSQYSRQQAELIATRQSLAQARRAKHTFSSFVGNSPASLEVKRLARRAAPLEAPVLLLGETGTGKELLAHAIHGASCRADKPLVSVNVAAIPDALLEVEFFGAAAGAYTGVDRKGRVGKFELAHGGTLFLDEIGDMPLPLQGKLLRALQEKEFEPLGSNRVVHADVRIIAATSMDLQVMVAQGRFRADLYYRLNVLTIPVPALRERLSDIEALSYSVLDKLCAHRYTGHLELEDGALQMLKAHKWPGNVRELHNTLERTVMFSDGARIDARSLAQFLEEGCVSATNRSSDLQDASNSVIPQQASAPENGIARYEDAMKAFERKLVQNALNAAGGQVASAAQLLGIGRATLYRKMAALSVSPSTES